MRTLLIFILPFFLTGAVSAQEKNTMMRSVVKSGTWRVRRKPHTIEEFRDNVTYERNLRKLRADWAEYDHASETLQARGKIQVDQKTDSGEKIRLQGHTLRHDRKSNSGALNPKSSKEWVHVEHYNAEGEAVGKGRARTLSWKNDGADVFMQGSVQYDDEMGTGRSENAHYHHPEKSVLLKGRRPVLSAHEKDWWGAVQADQIKAYRGGVEGRRVIAEGKTNGWIYFPHTAHDSASLRGGRP